jgi:hypothetical protein
MALSPELLKEIEKLVLIVIDQVKISIKPNWNPSLDQIREMEIIIKFAIIGLIENEEWKVEKV